MKGILGTFNVIFAPLQAEEKQGIPFIYLDNSLWPTLLSLT